VILQKRNRYLGGILMMTWIILCVIYVSKLEPIQTTEQLLDKNHPLQRGATILNEKFPTADDESNTNIYFVWGLNDVNRNGVRQLFDPNFVGQPVFDGDFEFNHECQTKMLQVCDFFKTNQSLEGLIKRKSGLRSVDCFIEELGAFNALGPEGTCEDLNNGHWRKMDWQVESNALNSTLTSFLGKTSCYDTTAVGAYYSDTLGWDGRSLKYVGISVESNLLDPWSTLPEDVVRAHYDEFMSLKETFDSSMQETCQSRVIVTDLDQKFIFMNNQKIYRKSAISGSMIGVFIAFIVLLLATRKLHIAFFATLMIACVLLSVIGSLSMMGWAIGTNEAILSSILAGFSVDYVVHLAHSYVVAHGSVENRIKEAFGEVGTSVLSGMLTSVIATIPLFMCTLTFFEKFGTCKWYLS
jgi:Predicted exporters of the RND superfamily